MERAQQMDLLLVTAISNANLSIKKLQYKERTILERHSQQSLLWCIKKYERDLLFTTLPMQRPLSSFK